MNVRLVQSSRYPNVWSLVDDNGGEFSRTWTDRLSANGAIAAESAVQYARDHDHTIVGIDRNQTDRDRDVIAGIEYRSRKPILGKFEHVTASGRRYHIIDVYPGGTASVIEQDTGWTDELPADQLHPAE